MVSLIFKDGTTLEAHKATPEQLVTWINESANVPERQQRKQFCFAFLYGATSQTLIQHFGDKNVPSTSTYQSNSSPII